MSEWYVSVRGQQEGPMRQDDLLAKIQSGQVDRNAYVFRQGMENWAPAGSQPELARARCSATSARC